MPDDFRAFYEREHGEQVRRAFLLTHSNEQANDVVHDAMIGVFQRWDDLENPGGYLNRSVLNGCRDVGRRTSSSRRALSSLRPLDGEQAENDVLDDALARLPFNQRAAVVLRYYGGWSSDEIARALDCSPNSIGPWITRALTTLRKDFS